MISFWSRRRLTKRKSLRMRARRRLHLPRVRCPIGSLIRSATLTWRQSLSRTRNCSLVDSIQFQISRLNRKKTIRTTRVSRARQRITLTSPCSSTSSTAWVTAHLEQTLPHVSRPRASLRRSWREKKAPTQAEIFQVCSKIQLARLIRFPP